MIIKEFGILEFEASHMLSITAGNQNYNFIIQEYN
jgi:hypothetical protein